MAQAEPLARRVDHINLVVPDPRALFATLANRLRLPVLWPPTSLPGLDAVGVPGFEIAAVGVGNVHIEPTRFEQTLTAASSADASRLQICLEPAPVEEAAEELERRAIPHSPPVPYDCDWPEAAETEIFHRVDRRRGRDRLWSWLFVGGLLGDQALAPHVFFCEFHAFDVAASRDKAREQLRRREGGPLGVERMREVVIAAEDLAAATERWRNLLDPAAPANGAFELGDGPAIRLTSGSEDRIEALVWEVASLARARRFLEEEDMLGAAGETELAIDPRAIEGLEIRLVERGQASPAVDRR